MYGKKRTTRNRQLLLKKLSNMNLLSNLEGVIGFNILLQSPER